MLNLILFGPPGAGKGTQAEYLIKNYQLLHISTGDLLRSEMNAGSELGLEARKYMEKGELVPDAVVIGIIKAKVRSAKNVRGFIFDGFPRTVEQAVALDEVLENNGTPVSGMLSLEVAREELIKRLLNRGRESGRADDQDQSVIENRISVYNQKTAPLIEYYRNQNKHYGINGVGSIGDIACRLKETVDKLDR